MGQTHECIYIGNSIENIEEVLKFIGIDKNNYEEDKLVNMLTGKEDTSYIKYRRHYDKDVTVICKDNSGFLGIANSLGLIPDLQYALDIKYERYKYVLWINGECIRPQTVFKSNKNTATDLSNISTKDLINELGKRNNFSIQLQTK